jgi:toxin ParE1/3/4
MYKLVVTELAHEDLDNIVSYIAVQLKSPRAATNFLADVERFYKFLISNPLMYEQY